MTDRHILVRDLIVHRQMERENLPNDQEELVRRRYWTFREQNRADFDHLEDLAVNLGNPEFTTRLERLTNEFCEWYKSRQ